MASTPPSSPPLPVATLPESRCNDSDDEGQVHHVPELFSPGSRSAETNGTGATGSTEPVGAATRSLMSSVDARGRRRGGSSDNADVDSERDVFGTPLLGSSTGTAMFAGASDESSWDRIDSPMTPTKSDNLASDTADPPVTSAFYLPTPEPEDRFGVQSGTAVREEPDPLPIVSSVRMRAEPADGHSWIAEGDTGESLEGGLTDSQEDVLLAQSVTRSQSDFSHWLEETLRLAKGDGTSTIESDDALSSILEATRHVRHSGRLGGLDLSQTTERASLINFGESALPEEDITISTLPSPPCELAGEGAIVQVGQGHGPEPGDQDLGADYGVNTNKTSASLRPRTWPWQLLSFFLAASIVYDRYNRQGKTAVTHTTMPTRSLAYAPLNQTILVSHFPTPLVVGSHHSSLWYASICSVLAMLGATAPWAVKRARPASFAPQCDPQARSSFPPLDTVSLAKARELLQVGIVAYGRSDLKAARAAFAAILDCACPASEKASASEWLGRTLYRLGRVHGDDRHYLREAADAFERSIRQDAQRATSRASLGRTLFRLGDYPRATKTLQLAVRRDDRLASAHEWLGKALSRLSPCDAPLVERHLRRAIELDPHSYTAYAFLGEFLHVHGGGRSTTEAKQALLRAVALRYDYPAAHLRLAYIATEQMDAAAANRHFSAAIETLRSGIRDLGSMPTTESALDGPTPYLAWYFAESPQSPRRSDILERALLEYPYDELLGLLQALGSASQSVTSTIDQGGSLKGDRSSQLEQRLSVLSKRTQRFTPHDDPIGHGLYALALLALGQAEEGEKAYSRFWSAVVDRRRQTTIQGPKASPSENGPASQEATRASTIAFLAMAFFERRATSATSPQTLSCLHPAAAKAVRRTPPRREGPKKASVVAQPAPLPTPQGPLRRSPRNVKPTPC